MAFAPCFIVVQLPRPYGTEIELRQYATKMKEIRLKGLTNDPGSFSSSLAMEIDQPIEFWTGRMTHVEAKHFIICVPPEGNSWPERDFDIFEATWVATLVPFGPRTIDLNNFLHDMSWKYFGDGSPRPAQSPSKGSILMYYITAVYVDSDFRRQGLGRKLSMETINAIKLELKRQGASKAVCMVEAEESNTSALKLYESLGWKEVAVDRYTAKDGRNIVSIQLRLDIGPA